MKPFVQVGEFQNTGIDVPEIAYVCQKCGAEDRDRGVNPPAPMVLNCWQCGAGRGQAPHEMLASGNGMVRIEAATGPVN